MQVWCAPTWYPPAAPALPTFAGRSRLWLPASALVAAAGASRLNNQSSSGVLAHHTLQPLSERDQVVYHGGSRWDADAANSHYNRCGTSVGFSQHQPRVYMKQFWEHDLTDDLSNLLLDQILHYGHYQDVKEA